jgi:hypothetical protein
MTSFDWLSIIICMCGEIQIVSHITMLCVFFGKILPNSNLKNMISTHTKPFSWKKGAQIHQISDFKNK